MHWFKEYPRSALLVLAIILILAGSLVVSRKSPVDTSLYSTGSGEGLSGASFSDYATQPDNIIIKPLPSSPIDTASNNPPFPYSSPFLSSDDNPILISEPPNTPAPELEKAPEKTGANFWSAFSFTPRGLISTSITTKTRTSEEKVLFDYGNELGSYIGAFDDAHQNTTSMFQDFFSARGAMPAGEVKKGSEPKPVPPPSDGGKSAMEGILATAKDYSRLGDTISNMSSVPKEAQALSLALAQGYSEIGAGLGAIVSPSSDLGKAVVAYNESADKFIKNFVALADFFGARGIKFSSSDPGNVFSFTPNSL